MPIPFDIGPFEIGSTTLRASAAGGAAASPWVGPGADPARLDPIVQAGVRVTPAAAGLDVAGPYGVRGTVRVEAGTVGTVTPTLQLAELRTGWDAPGGYGGVGLGRIHVPLASDRRYETEGLALSTRPLLSQFGNYALHAPGFDGTVSWPSRASLRVGGTWPSSTSDAPFLWARVDLTPLGDLPDHEDGDAAGVRLGAGGTFAYQRSAARGDERWIAGDATFVWRHLGVDVGWISRTVNGRVSDDQWVAAHSRVAPLPASTDLFVAGRLEWVDGIVEDETARIQGTGRLSWRALAEADGDGDGDAWAAVYVEGTLSREDGPGLPGPEDGEALDLGAERSNDWLQLGVWTRW